MSSPSRHTGPSPALQCAAWSDGATARPAAARHGRTGRLAAHSTSLFPAADPLLSFTPSGPPVPSNHPASTTRFTAPSQVSPQQRRLSAECKWLAAHISPAAPGARVNLFPYIMRDRFSMLIVLAVVFSLIAAAGPVSIVSVESNKPPAVVARDETQPPSESAELDRALLSIQIGGIVGAYVVSIAFVFGLLLFVGRRLRRDAQTSNYTLEMMMMHRPVKEAISTDPSPISPVSREFPSPGKSGFTMSWSSLSKAHRSQASAGESVTAVDESVVSSDRRRAQEEMEALYAAVMEHDAQKSNGASPVLEEEYPSQPMSPLHSPRYTSYANPTLSPEGSSFQRQEQPPKQGAGSRSSSRLSKISNLSIFSSNSRSSGPLSGKLRSPRMSIRKLPISPPMGSPDVAASGSHAENQPLTPRLYTPGPPPPAPYGQTPGKTPTQISQTRAPAPAPLNFTGASNSSSTLPFRQVFSPPQSAPATKTTILERPVQLNGPRTGVPTPYSPYMPFTPVTPITPSRMMTREERKRKAKGHGLRVLTEDDMVKSDEDMWGA